MTRGPKFGFSFGMGAVSADIFYLTAISMGAAAVIRALPDWGKAVLAFVAAALIAMIGIRALRTRPGDIALASDAPSPPDSLPGPLKSLSGTGLKRSYLLGFALTLSSPTTILYWLTVSANTVALFASDDMDLTLPLVLSVGITCTIWVAMVVTLASRFHRSINPRTVFVIERVVGGLLLLFAALSAYGGIRILTVGESAAPPKVPTLLKVHSRLDKGFDMGPHSATAGTSSTAPRSEQSRKPDQPES